MAGNGPRPKDASKRARTNKDTITPSLVTFVKGNQPRLPRLPSGKWNPRTLVWWDKWKTSPQATLFMATDWEFLLETALIHHNFWNGDMTMAGELRLRVAKFGATIEDRVKLRIQYAQASEAENKVAKVVIKAEDRYSGLKAVEAQTA